MSAPSLRYPLDLPNKGYWDSVWNTPYPAKPNRLAISDDLFMFSMNMWTCVIFSALYYICTQVWNRHLASRKTPFSDLTKTNRALAHFVLAHNVFLCVYSGWTSVNVNARVLQYFGNGLLAGGYEGLKTAYCTIPTWDSTLDLSLYVTLFYYSKAYEVIDSVILALKGKPISNLQSYHHAGALITMGVAVRYSDSAAWIFASFNSTIHTFMYLFYACSLLKVRVPAALKQSMTTAQITQLVVGIYVASMYHFTHYLPSAYPDAALHSAGYFPSPYPYSASILSSTDSMMSFSRSNGTTAASSSAPLSIAARQAAEESVRRALAAAASQRPGGRLPCQATSGQSWALFLNVAYLAPLICLFLAFFVKTYLRKPSKAANGKSRS